MKRTKTYLSTIGLFFLCCSTSFSSEKISLPATGSSEPAHTVFTSPAESPVSSMNVSWATAPDVCQTYIEYTTREDSAWTLKRIVFPTETRLSTAFDSIHSKLADNSDVYERHVFLKRGATLSGLKPDTRYVYRVVSRRHGQLVKTDTRSVKTAGADSWKAAVIGDFHHYSPLWSRLDHATAMVDVLDSVADGVDWILSTGDQAAWGASYNYWTELAEQPMYKKLHLGFGRRQPRPLGPRKERLFRRVLSRHSFQPDERLCRSGGHRLLVQMGRRSLRDAKQRGDA